MRRNPENPAEILFSRTETDLIGITTVPIALVDLAIDVVADKIGEADRLAGCSIFPENIRQANRAMSLRIMSDRLIGEYLPRPSDENYAELLGGSVA